MSFKLYDYQQENANKGSEVLQKKGLVYLHFEVRTGKTLTALEICKINKHKKVLFVTKKKAISSIQGDYDNFNYIKDYEIYIINYESLHKVDFTPDIIILDEAHVLGAFAKPSKRTRLIKDTYKHLPMIFLSGTPAVESSSQWFHQFWISAKSPFAKYTTFYKWAKDYVNVVDRHLGYGVVKDYSQGLTDMIELDLKEIVLTYTQKQSGFKSKVNKTILHCEMLPIIKKLSNQLKKDSVIQGKDTTIIADSAVKLLSKMHQFSGGTVILDDESSIILDYSKAEYIKNKFKEKIAIFYYFKKELELIKKVFGDNLTTDLEEFNNTDKTIALQQYSGAEGISLKKANKLIFYNWGMSGVKFIQSIDRMTTKDRLENDVYFICGKYTISHDVLKRVLNKESYGVESFKRDYGKY